MHAFVLCPIVIQGKFKEAEPLHRRALAIAEDSLGTEHPDFSLHLNDLGLLLAQQVTA